MTDRRRALMGAASASQLVDTSATAAAFYVRKTSNEKHIAGARANGTVKIWRDSYTSSGDFSSANYTNAGLNSTDYYHPWEDVQQALRCKFGGTNTAPSTTPTTVGLDSAYAYWKESGRIMFAGKNTPFYGMANIDGTLATPGWTG